MTQHMVSQPEDENRHSKPGSARRNTEQRSLDDERDVVQNTRSRSKLTNKLELAHAHNKSYRR